MSLQSIPEKWRRRVASILRRGDPQSILPTKDFTRRFSAAFPDAFAYEIHEALAETLSNDTAGCPADMNPPPKGTTWEFYSQFRGRRIYAKALLTDDGKMVALYSAHPPNKKRLRCE